MKVVLVEPGKEARLAEIGEDLRSMQKAVGGLIQAVYPYEDKVALICNDEGKLMGLPFNRALRNEDGQIYDTVAGTFFVCGLTEDNFCGLIEQQAERYLAEFREPAARVNCRVQFAQKELLIFDEIVSLHMPKVQESVAAALAEVGLCPTDYSVVTALHQRSPGIETQDASCIVSGYACDETPELLAEQLSKNLSQAGEVMVVVEYDEDGRPLRVDQISVAAEQDNRFVHNVPGLVEQVLQGFPLDKNSKLTLTILPPEPYFHVSISEPMHGKNPDNLERSAVLMARYIAKNIVAAKLARQCQVTLAYAAGAAEPVMVTVDSFGTGGVCADDCLAEAAKMVFELEKQKLTSWIKLSSPNYFDISLGRRSGPWERTDKVAALRNAVL